MPATEISVTSMGTVAGKEGPVLPHLQDWGTAQLKAKKPVKDVSNQVLMKGIKQWAGTLDFRD